MKFVSNDNDLFFYQTKFSSRSRGWVELPSDSDCSSRIKLRLDHDLKNKEDSRRLSQASEILTHTSSSQAKNVSVINVHDKESVMELFEDTLEVKLNDVTMTLSLSFVMGLADLAEDEIIPKPIPIKVSHRITKYISELI